MRLPSGVWLMWWVQAVAALAALRSLPRRPHRVEVTAEALRAAHPRHLPAPHGGHHRGHSSSLSSPALRPPPVEAVPASVAVPASASAAIEDAARARRRKASLSGWSREARDDSAEASSS
jgi:hypothetical protein